MKKNIKHRTSDIERPIKFKCMSVKRWTWEYFSRWRRSGMGVSPVCFSQSKGLSQLETHGRDDRATIKTGAPTTFPDSDCNLVSFARRMSPLAAVFLVATSPLYGQTNSETTNAPLKLLPPYGELPPTFLEQHGTAIAFAGLGTIALAALGGWLIFRPKPKIIVPPEVEARQQLEWLRQRPEDGVVLSRVSQVMRSYFIAAFQLTKGEFTTAEFCREISGNEKISAELAMAAADFLRDCDREKFSSQTGPAKLAAANRALNLVEQAEQRRAQLRQLAETQTEGRRA
jgi:hypothetical protein